MGVLVHVGPSKSGWMGVAVMYKLQCLCPPAVKGVVTPVSSDRLFLCLYLSLVPAGDQRVMLHCILPLHKV